jgi:glutamate dehydrogenase/leucine dehydrogenase
MSDPHSNAKRQLETVAEIINLEDDMVELLSEPNKLLRVSIPVKMDDGSMRTFVGFRSQHSNARGPYKGGIRFHQDVSESEVKALSMWMSWKTSTADIPLGGGKGGVIVDPKQLSNSELEKLARGYAKCISEIIGEEKDIPAPDVNTTPEIMDWMSDAYRQASGVDSNAVFTGKPVESGGSQGRTEATGYGGVYILEELLAAKDENIAGMSVAIQGFGNVGYYFAELAHEQGMKIVALSDSKGGIYAESGIDPKQAMAYKQENGKLQGMPESENISNDELLLLDAEVLVPSALENVISKDNADEIKAKYIMEMANGPVTPEADEVLYDRGIISVPDILANAGGVTVSYFEWLQNLQQEKWEKKDVLDKLREKMKTAFKASYESMNKRNVDMRMGTYALAVARVAEATLVD